MRTILITLAFIATLTTQAGAEEIRYSPKDCARIVAGIDFLLRATPDMWNKLKKDPNDTEVALELSWAVGLAANYTTTYKKFCKEDN